MGGCYAPPQTLVGGDEMAVRALHVALLLSVLALTGCGTAVNLTKPGPETGGDGKLPFGGVRQDVECIKTAANGELGLKSGPRSGWEQYPQAAVILFCSADLPFSLIGDIVTWPYAAAYTFINEPVPTPAVLVEPAPPVPPLKQVPADAPPKGPPSKTPPRDTLPKTLPKPTADVPNPK